MPRARPVATVTRLLKTPGKPFAVLHICLLLRYIAAMSDKPPPDRTLYVSPTQPGLPVEVGWVSRFVLNTATEPHSIVVVLSGGAPEGYAAELSDKLRLAFLGTLVEVL